MSTKVSIEYGEDFHFYRDCYDDENVYLEIDNPPDYEASPSQITVAIPIHIFEAVRNSEIDK